MRLTALLPYARLPVCRRRPLAPQLRRRRRGRPPLPLAPALDPHTHFAARCTLLFPPCPRSEDALNEIRILASIRSRNIVRYCDAFCERDNLYIIMECVHALQLANGV